MLRAKLMVALAVVVLPCGCADDGGGGALPPEITTQPLDETVDEGQSVTFTVVAAGSGTLSYQWQRSDDGSSWSDIASATAADYTIASASMADDGAEFACVVTNAGGSTTSDVAVLTVNDISPPTPGGAGVLTVTPTTVSLSVSWEAGADNVSQVSALSYRLYYSLTNPIATAEDVLAHGTPVGDWQQGMLSAPITGLASGTQHYVNVLIRDELLNHAAYASSASRTIADVVEVGGVRMWSDGSCAATARGYLEPPPGYEYSGSTGDGVYRLQIGALQRDYYCDMTTDGGGWIMVSVFRSDARYQDFILARNDAAYGSGQTDPDSATSWSDWYVLSCLSWPVELAVIVDQVPFQTGWQAYNSKVIYRVKSRDIMPHCTLGADLVSGDNLYYKFNPALAWTDVGSASSSDADLYYPRDSANQYLAAFHSYVDPGGVTGVYFGVGIPGGNNSWYHGAHLLVR